MIFVVAKWDQFFFVPFFLPKQNTFCAKILNGRHFFISGPIFIKSIYIQSAGKDIQKACLHFWVSLKLPEIFAFENVEFQICEIIFFFTFSNLIILGTLRHTQKPYTSFLQVFTFFNFQPHPTTSISKPRTLEMKFPIYISIYILRYTQILTKSYPTSALFMV